MTDRALLQRALDALDYASEKVYSENNDDIIAVVSAELRAALAAPASVGDKPATSEPVAWQWRRKGEPWSREQTWTHEVFATTDDSEVRVLYAAPPDVQRDAERYRWLRANGSIMGLSVYEAGTDTSFYNDGADEAVDAAMAAKVPT